MFVSTAATQIPAEMRARLDSTAALSAQDRQAIVEIARQALAAFQPTPVAEADEATT